MFHQTFELHDLLVICLLIVLEAALSMDNALVLGLLARRLPESLRAKALTYGLVGTLIFRIAAITAASALLRWRGSELIGGLFLVSVAIKHLGFPRKLDPQPSDLKPRQMQKGFWLVVGTIELTDIAFAIDSIVAALALVGPAPLGTPPHQLHPKLWVVIVGGMGGVLMMRFAAMLFIRVLDRFPRFETSAYLLVLIIGAKMLVGYFLDAGTRGGGVHFQDPASLAFWIFWMSMLGALVFGFVPSHAPANE